VIFIGPQAHRPGGQVYRCFDVNGRLRYIGSSYDARRRFLSGAYNGNGVGNGVGSWWQAVRVVLVENYPTRRDAYAAELRAQRREGLPAKGLAAQWALYTEQPSYLLEEMLADL
jgi:GIY-YIG catalytic domain